MIKNAAPVQASVFIGRKSELKDVVARLENPNCRLLTITGLGGSGKTRLAIEAAQSITGNFLHGVIFVPLQPLNRSELVVSTIAQALGLTFYGDEAPEMQLFNFLHERSYLLLLDNFEHLLEGAMFISTLLVHAPNIKLLVTSREALNLQEEWLYPLKGMAIPPSVYSTSLRDYEAVQLFLYHARRVQPGFDLIKDNASVIRICSLTAGLPLAIELAASWLKGLSTAQIALEIQDNLDFLSTAARNVEERHRSMRAVFNQSWRLLSESARLIFAKLSVFSGGFSAEAAGYVALASLFDLLSLVEKSLIQSDNDGRFRIHELLRQYGMEKLEACGETTATYDLHSYYFAQWMQQYETGLKSPQQLDILRAIETDFENIRLAWEWVSRYQQLQQLHSMLNTLYLFGFLRNRYRDTISLFQYALEQSPSETSLMGRLLARRWGYLHWWYQADYQDALAGIQQSLNIATTENNVFETAFSHLMTAYAMISMKRPDDAIAHLEISQALFTSINEPYYVCWVLHRMGYVYFNLNQTEPAKRYTEQSLVLARLSHNRVALVICLYNLGSDYILSGDYVKGKQYCLEALQVATEAGHQGQVAHALSLVALCAFCQGDYSACQDNVQRSYVIIEDINMFVFQPYNIALLILLACLREDYDHGLRLHELAKRYITNLMGEQVMHWALAALSCGLSDHAEAETYIDKLLQHSDIDNHPAIITWIIPLAAFVLAEKDREKAIELLSWAFAVPGKDYDWIHQWPLFDTLRHSLQDTTDALMFQTAWENGKALTFHAISDDIQQSFGGSQPVRAESAKDQLLTVREREILRLLADGLTNPQIADRLVIGAGTVKTHTLNIYRKLDVANRTQAILRAQELGLLHL
jgi:predicted ATPase/DNA-binding CsgD family transcriptional regulator